MIFRYNKKHFLISTDKRKLKLKVIHGFLSKSYWDKGITKKEVRLKIKNSICYGIYDNERQIGFARIITDYLALAYIADVFVVEQYRGLGLSKWLMNNILKNPNLNQVKTWMLKTTDAHGLYEKFGFKTVINTNQIMEKKKGGTIKNQRTSKKHILDKNS